MTMHERMESLTDVYVAGGLTAAERGEVDRHIAECPACAALLRDAREFASWAKGLIKTDAPPSDLEDRVIGRFRAAGASKKRRFPVGKRFFKLTGSIAAAVGLIFLGNAFTDGHADGYLGEVRTQIVALSGVQAEDAAVKLRRLTTASADFRASDRNWGESGDFESFFGRNLGRKLNEDEYSRRLSADLGVLEDKHANLAREKKLTDGRDRGGEAGRTDFYVEDLTAAPAHITRGLGEVEKLGKVVTESLSEGKPEMPKSADPKSAAPLGFAKDGPTTLAVAKDATDLKATVAAGGEPAEARPVTLNPASVLQDNRKIIRTAEVSVEVDSYDATYTKLTELMTAEKGLVASANTNKAANGKISATVVLRVPPERFEAVLAKLKDFGTIRNQNVDSEDVTKAYIDLETRLKSKEILAERLKKLLAEGKGTVKELMEVEVQLGTTNEAIESLKGEIKYYDNRIGLSTLTLQIAEKDLGQPFEFVQTMQANLALTARDPDDVYAKAQKEIADAGGQVVDSRMTRQNDGSSTGFIRGRVDADKFPSLRETLKKLGVPTNDTVNQQKTARGGHEGTPKADAPLRKEQAVLDLTISSPPLFVTRRSQILVETATVDTAYQASRKAVEGAGGKIVDGSLTGRVDGMQATLRIQVDADKFQALVDSLKTAGKVKNANVNSVLPAASSDGSPALLRERAEIDFALVTPPQLIGEEQGLWKSVQDTFAKSWAGLLWSIEKLFVGISLAGPWVALGLIALFFWRRRKKAVSSP